MRCVSVVRCCWWCWCKFFNNAPAWSCKQYPSLAAHTQKKQMPARNAVFANGLVIRRRRLAATTKETNIFNSHCCRVRVSRIVYVYGLHIWAWGNTSSKIYIVAAWRFIDRNDDDTKSRERHIYPRTWHSPQHTERIQFPGNDIVARCALTTCVNHSIHGGHT